MTYLDYIVFFEKRDQQQPKGFSGNTTRLYLKLLAVANGIGWPAEFAKSDPYVAGVCNLAINTMKGCRKELVAAGLLMAVEGGTGRNAATMYTLLKPSKSDGLSAVNTSKSDGFTPESEINPSKSDVLPTVNPSKFDEFSPKNPANPSKNTSNFDTLYIEEEKKESSAASAAPASVSSPPKPAPKKPKVKGATHEEIAGLPLPFDGAEFAEAWLTFYTTNTKQAGKALTAFQLMLKKLSKLPEAFAVVTLERAVMSNWQGVEHGGSGRDLAEWQAEQARRPAPTPAAPESQPSATPDMNPEFLAQREAEQAAKRAARLAELEPTTA